MPFLHMVSVRSDTTWPKEMVESNYLPEYLLIFLTVMAPLVFAQIKRVQTRLYENSLARIPHIPTDDFLVKMSDKTKNNQKGGGLRLVSENTLKPPVHPKPPAPKNDEVIMENKAIGLHHATPVQSSGPRGLAQNFVAPEFKQNVITLATGLQVIHSEGELFNKQHACATTTPSQGKRSIYCKINFKVPFLQRPHILLDVSSLDAKHDSQLQYNMAVQDTSRTGFTIGFHTWGMSEIENASIVWVACSQEGPEDRLSLRDSPDTAPTHSDAAS